MTSLSAECVSVGFGEPARRVSILNGLSVTIHSGELTLVRGPSGSGKSTLLAILGGLLTPDRGTVTINDVCVTNLTDTERAAFRLDQVGFVFQTFQLFDSLTALENIALPLVMRGEGRVAANRRAHQLLLEMGVSHRAASWPAQLSGGEQQRVAVARAFALDPPVILADEPTAALDGVNGQAIAALLAEAAVKLRKLVVVISHDERLLPFAGRVITLRDGVIASDERQV